MPEEKNNQDNLNVENSAGENEKADGRIFSGTEESGEKVNVDEEVEKNIRIRTMPRKLKISSKTGEKKTAVVGIVIMVVGLLVLASAVYLVYIFLINPQAKQPAEEVKTPVVTKSTSTPAIEATSTPSVATSTTSVATSTTTVATSTTTVATSTTTVATSTTTVATSTTTVATSTTTVATSTTGVATSTTGIPGAPTGAKVVGSLSVAEKDLFGADISKTDSDGDSFDDLSEVLNLYNPAGAGKITANLHIDTYQNTFSNYSVYYPRNWKTQNLEDGNLIIFTAADSSLIQIISQTNTNKQDIKTWYNEQFPNMPATDADIYSRDGWQGVFQQDKEIFYLADTVGNRLYTISYVSAATDDQSFYNIFLMMINSFTVQ